MQKRRGGFSALTWKKRVERFWQSEALGQFWFPDGQRVKECPANGVTNYGSVEQKESRKTRLGMCTYLREVLDAVGLECVLTCVRSSVQLNWMCAYLREVINTVGLEYVLTHVRSSMQLDQNTCLPAWDPQCSWTGMCAYLHEVLKAVRLERVLTCVRSSMQLDWNVCLPPWGPQCSWTVVHAYLCEIFKAVGLESVLTCVRSSMQLDWSESVSSETGRHWGTADKEVRTFPCSSRVWNITAHKLNQHLRFLQAEKQPPHWHNGRNTIVWNITTLTI